MPLLRTPPAPLFTKKLLSGPVAALALTLAASAQAGLFDDEEARKQILQLRNQIAETQRTLDQRVAELEAQARNRSIIDLFNQVETLKAEFARLRGQIELLQNEMENTQKRQRDLYVDLDGRLRKVETQLAAAQTAAPAPAAMPPARRPPRQPPVLVVHPCPLPMAIRLAAFRLRRCSRRQTRWPNSVPMTSALSSSALAALARRSRRSRPSSATSRAARWCHRRKFALRHP